MNKLLSLFRPRKDIDMTQGAIVPHLLRFAFPLLLGNLFQQFYNTVDSWVVGNYVSKEAFAAVGSVGPITNVLIGCFMGLASGAGVVISQYYGARQHEKVSQTVHTSIVMTLVMGVVLSILGVIVSPLLLQFMKTPESVMPEATAYLRIYFAGVMGLMIYNMGSGILRAVGDSQRPFYFLMCSALLNIVLDLVFVLGLGMGVEGVALATVIAQAVSALLVLRTLFQSDSCIQLFLNRLKCHFDVLKQVVQVGIPAAIQMMVLSFSNIFVQSYINYFGDNCMAGWAAYNKIDMFMFLPMQSISLASTTFVGQNMGIGQRKRARQGVTIAVWMTMVITVAIMIPVVACAPYLVGFFNSDPEVITFGTMFLRYIAPFYIICCVNQIYFGALRGAGNTKVPMVIMLLTFVLLRQIYMYIMANFISNTLIPVAFGYPVGWIACTILTFTYYHKVPWDQKKLIQVANIEE